MCTEILLVDDDGVTNFVHQYIIESKIPGVPIKSLYNGADALEYILENPDKRYLIFLDLNMPVMNGLEFLEAIETKKARLHFEIHVLTSSIDPRDQQNVSNFSFVCSFMQKPLDEAVLDELIVEKVKNSYS